MQGNKIKSEYKVFVEALEELNILKSFDVEQQLIDDNYLLTHTDAKIDHTDLKIDKMTNILVDIQSSLVDIKSRLIHLEKPEGINTS